jgi:hypothetical protein
MLKNALLRGNSLLTDKLTKGSQRFVVVQLTRSLSAAQQSADHSQLIHRTAATTVRSVLSSIAVVQLTRSLSAAQQPITVADHDQLIPIHRVPVHLPLLYSQI